MATKLTDLTALGATPASGDFLHVVDISDTTGGAAGTSKKVAYSNVGGGGSSGGLVTAGGGRLTVFTSSDAGVICIGWGGSLGFSYYVWSNFLGTNPLTTGGDLGTPGTTQLTTLTLQNTTNCMFTVPVSGVATLNVTQEFDSSTEVQGHVMRYMVWKADATMVTALQSGSGGAGLTATLVASAKVTIPALNQSKRPMTITSTNGVSVTAGDLLFGCTVYDGTLTTTQYFATNVSIYTV